MIPRELRYEVSVEEYMELLDREGQELLRIREAGENEEVFMEGFKEIREELKHYCTFVLPEMRRRLGLEPEEAAPVIPIEYESPSQTNPVEEELEEEYEEEEEEWYDFESERPKLRCPFTKQELEAIYADYDATITPDMVESERAMLAYLRDLSLRHGLMTLEEFVAMNLGAGLPEDIRNEAVNAEVIDLYNEVAKTELVIIVEAKFYNSNL